MVVVAINDKWTVTEMSGFLKWDEKRKNGELGIPVCFATVNELERWLYK